MAIMIRIAAILGAVWAVVVGGLLTTLGAVILLFDPSQNHEFINIVVGFEIVLLIILWHAGKLRLLAAPALLVWFIALSGLLNSPFVWSNWPQVLWGVMGYFLPAAITMLLLTIHGVITYVQARRKSQQKAPVVPPLPVMPALPIVPPLP